MMISVLEYLEAAVETWSNKIAYCDQNSKATFFDVMKKAKIVGSFLQNKIQPRQPIVVLTDRRIVDIEIFLGIVYTGCYYAPIDANLPLERVNSILSTVKPRIILSSAENVQLLDSIESTFENVYSFEELTNGDIDESALRIVRRQLCDVDPLYAVFTSGSTGEAKGVLTSHRSLIDYIDSFCDVVKIDENDIIGGQASLDYVAAIRDIYLPLKTGACTVLLDKKLFSTPNNLFAELNKNKITTLCWASSALSIPVKLNTFLESELLTVNKVIFTGSVFPSSNLAIWQQHLPGAFFMNQYGSTEITASCTYHIVNHPVSPSEILPIGVPFPNTQIILLSENGSLISDGEKGEICVAGSCLALGYLNNYELTKRSFIENPANKTYPQTVYKTGDIGSLDENGILWFHGRKDSQIKHMGYRVELSEIEQAALSVKGINKSVCLYDSERAYIYLFYEGIATVKEIASELRKTLPGYMVPRKFVQLVALPRTQNGKIDRNSLKEYFT